MPDPNSTWNLDEFLALLGTSKKTVITTEAALVQCVALLNGASPDVDDPAHSYDEIALAAMVGLLASGRFGEDAGTPGVVAWTVVLPAFLRGKAMFLADPTTYLATSIV